MSSRKVSEGEEKYVAKALEEFGGPGDEAVWMDWVLKKKREKIQDRLLVVSHYRILSIKRNKVGKKTTQRQGHLYALRKIAIDKDMNRCVLKFPDFHIEFSSPHIQDVLDTIRNSFHKISHDWPESAFFQVNAPEACLKDLEERDVTPTEGLLEVYTAYCNFYTQPPSPDFKRFVEDTFQTGTAEFNISKCPGIEPKTDYTFDLRPALACLAHCKHFRSFKLEHILRREAVGVFALALSFNQTITRLVLSGLDAGPEGVISLGDAFKKNPGNKVCELDLSDNKMGERGIAGLSSGLMTIQHGLTRFNIGKNGLTPKGITSLIASLRANSQVSGTLLELDLSQNKFEAVGSQAFADWVTDLKECATIETLNLSDTAIDVQTVMTGIRLGLLDSITNLDISYNRIEKLGAQAIALLLESSPNLKYLNVSYCKLPPEGIEQLLLAIRGNEAMSDLKIDFSGNELGVAGADKAANGLESNEKLHTLILQDNGLKVEGMKKILATLMDNSSIRCLDLSSNLRSSTNTKPLTEQLCQFLKKHSNLETLLLNGDGKSAYGKDIVDLFNALNDCPTLTELEVSNNRFGDKTATEISESLRKNTTLTYMAWDNNGVNIGGYQAFRSCLVTSNKTILEVPHPRNDVEKAVSAAKDPAKFRERITELFNEINAALKSNRDAKGVNEQHHLKTNIFARQKEEY